MTSNIELIDGNVWFRGQYICDYLGVDVSETINRLKLLQQKRNQFVRYVNHGGHFVSYISVKALTRLFSI